MVCSLRHGSSSRKERLFFLPNSVKVPDRLMKKGESPTVCFLARRVVYA